MNVWGFGIVRAEELERAGRSTFDDLCALISDASGVKFRPFIATSYRELSSTLERGEAGLAWLPPLPAIELDSCRVATVLAIPARNGCTTYNSALVVRRGGPHVFVGSAQPHESRPRTVADLRGRRAVWVQRDSASGYIVPRMHLASCGIDVLRYFARELFVHSHPAVIDAVVSGEADVGATYCHVDTAGKVLRAAWLDDDGRSLRPIDVLAVSASIPNDALVASNELSASARSTLTRWLLDPPNEARHILASLLGSSDFRVPSVTHYDPLKHMVRAARARGHDADPSSSRTGIRIARRFT